MSCKSWTVVGLVCGYIPVGISDEAHSHLPLITMADQPSSTAAKKSKNKADLIKHVRGLFKRPKSMNDSASQSNVTQASVNSALNDHDPVLGNEAELKTSSKYMTSS